MNDQPVALPPDAPADPRGGVKIFGVLLILSGAACAGLFLLIVAAAFLSPMAPGGQTVDPRMLIPSGVIYLVIGAGFVALGIGSWRVRRWARPLILIVGWAGVFGVALGAVVAALMVPRIFASEGPGGMSIGCVLAPLFFGFAILLAFPIALILYYRRPAVAALFDARDPGPSWTDRTPPVLLGLAVLMWVGAIASLGGAFAYPAIPMFGLIVEGWPLRLLFVALAVVSAWIGWAVYRRQMAGFWSLVALQAVGLVNLYMMKGLDEETLYRSLGYSDADAQQAARLGLFDSGTFLIAMGVCWLILTVALFAIRKHFVPASRSGSAAPPPV